MCLNGRICKKGEWLLATSHALLVDPNGHALAFHVKVGELFAKPEEVLIGRGLVNEEDAITIRCQAHF